MTGAEYPKALYRDGGDTLIWGQPVQTRIVSSPEQEKEALAAGWRLHPIPRRGRPPKQGAGNAA